MYFDSRLWSEVYFLFPVPKQTNQHRATTEQHISQLAVGSFTKIKISFYGFEIENPIFRTLVTDVMKLNCT